MVSEHLLYVKESFGRKNPTAPNLTQKNRGQMENKELTGEGFGLTGKVCCCLRPRSFLLIPVRIGKPKHRTKNNPSRGKDSTLTGKSSMVAGRRR
jgi:hypothetical protein